MPTEQKKGLAFKILQALWFVPVALYFDLESLVQTVISCANAAQSTQFVEIHRPSGFCIAGVEHGKPEPVFVQWEGPEKCKSNFVKALEQLTKETYARKQSQHINALTKVKYGLAKTIYNAGSAKSSSRQKTKRCWIIDKILDKFWLPAQPLQFKEENS